jgi:hypothetical protein
MQLSIREFKKHSRLYDGYCTHCDAITRSGRTEPDAENYECPNCEKKSCLGMDYALMGDYLQFPDEE